MSKLHFLIIESNPEDQDRLQQTLLMHFPTAKFKQVLSGKNALTELSNGSFDIILLTHSFPGINGLDILKKMKETGSSMPFIMITANNDPKMIIDAFKCGIYDYLIKSPDMNYLHMLPPMIHEVLEKWRKFQSQKQFQEEYELLKQENSFLIDFFIHEVASIHNAALGYLDLLDEGAVPPSTLSLYLAAIRRNLQRSHSFVDVMKILSSAQMMSPDSFSTMNLIGSIRRSITVIEQSFPQYKLEFSTYFTAEQCPIHATPLLDFIFINLLSNAVKYDPNPSKQVEISVIDIPKKNCWRVSITDHGAGIPDDEKPLLFQRLTRLARDQTKQGYGLGLFIVRTLVEKFGGQVRVENRLFSDPSHGSRFICEFPKKSLAF